MSDHPNVAIFWDYENCNPPSNSSGLGYDIVNNISRIARLFGSVTSFRAYLDISAQSTKSVVLRSELQSSGVSLIDCPHNGRKDVVDKMILVDMLAFAVDHSAPATIILIAGDRDYAYAVSTLKLRKYQVILIVPSPPNTSPSLENQASLVIDWNAAALRARVESGNNSVRPVRQPYPELNADFITGLLRELQDPALDDPDPATHPSSTPQNSTKLRRTSTRDLLEPSRPFKNLGSSVLMQEITTPASPRASTSTERDPASGELSIPKTPSRSRHASVSTGSTRARSSTFVGQCSPVAEPDTLAKDPPPITAKRSSPSNVTDAVSPAERSPPVLPSLDTLELPPHDNHPPSSIAVRSPLEFNQSIPDSGRRTSYKFNCLASPFAMPKARAGTKSLWRPSNMMAGPTTSPTVAAKSLPMRETTNINDDGTPEEIERLTRLIFDDSDTDSDSGRSDPHSMRSMEVDDTADTPQSTHDSYVTPPTTYSPLSTNVGVHLTGTPSYKHASLLAATPPGVGDSVSPPSATSSHVSNTLWRSPPGSSSLSSTSAFPSSPFTAPEPYERQESGRRETWTMFQPLVHVLLAAKERGFTHPSRSTIAVELVQSDKQVYQRAGVSRFRDYTALAEQAGIIELGGREANAWIALNPNWMESVVTSHNHSSGDSSLSFDPPTAVQSSLLTDPKAPPVGEDTISQSAIFDWPQFSPSQRRSTLPTSSGRQVGDSSTFILPRFLPLIHVLVRLRAEGLHKPLRSVVGQLLGQDVYTLAGVLGFKEYVDRASEAQLVQLGGIGGRSWIRLYPELQI